jgi:uncharacterized protein
LSGAALSAAALIERLALMPHPEGGWYREIYRSRLRVQAERGERAALTSIYYLLEPGQLGRWHVVAAEEVWHFYGGSGLELFIYEPGARALRRERLGEVQEGAAPVSVVPTGCWQAARPFGGYALLGCTVAPGFEFADFRFVCDLPEHAEHFRERLYELRTLL